jgi:hypothetical protein
VGGSDILLTLSGTQSRRKYEILLAEGKCSAPQNAGWVIGSGAGDELARVGIRIRVNTPTHALTKSDYILFAREATGGRAVACGPITAEAPY